MNNSRPNPRIALSNDSLHTDNCPKTALSNWKHLIVLCLVTYICVGELVIIGEDSGLSSVRQQAIFNTLRPKQNDRHFPDDIQMHFLEWRYISVKISLEFVPKGQINNIPSLVQIMAWRRLGDKPLSEPMMVSLMTQIWVTRPQWVK